MTKFNYGIVAALLVFIPFIKSNVHCQNISEKKFEKLGKLLEKKFSNDFDFSVLIEIDSIRVYTQNFGFLDKQKTKLVNGNTLYNVASITKGITAVGIMKLMDQNKINLQDRLDNFFKNIPEDKAAITIHMLLSHQSGFDHNYKCEGISSSTEALNILFNDNLGARPGERFTYTGQNYQLLALVIEKVTGRRYEDFIRKEILNPLKMTETYFWDEVNKDNNLIRTNRKMLKMFGKRNWGWIGAAGIFSTTNDLSKFWNGIYRASFLSEESRASLFRSYYETSSGTQIGYGFYKRNETKWVTPEMYTRGTESWGHNSVIRYFPEKNTLIVVSTNSGEYGKNRMTGNKEVSDFIANYLFK